MTTFAFDVETHLIAPGDPAPPLVCASFCDGDMAEILDRDAGIVWFRNALEAGHRLVGVNFTFDLSVMVAEDATLLPLVFQALDEGRLEDLSINEALHDNARGCIYTDEHTGAPIGRYSLALLEKRYTGNDRTADKSGDSWRLRYAELDGIPLSEWPDDARAYPLRDARGTYAVWLAQQGHENQQCRAQEMQAAWMLRLASCWGLRTDPELVAHTVDGIQSEHETSRRRFALCGIVKVAPAAADETPDNITREWIDVLSSSLSGSEEWHERRRKELVSALKRLDKDKPLRFATDTARLQELVTAAYQGSPPTTDTGRVSTSRDTLEESDHPLLLEYAEAGNNEKLLAAFVPVLKQGTEFPISPGSTTPLATQRTSYSSPNLQQLPRSGGVRECFVPNPGWVLCSVDYGALELCTLSQVCINTGIHSEMAAAINAGQDLHLRLAARVAGVTYEEALQNKAKYKELRQVMKIPNFGFGGLMGPPKLVLSARKQGTRFCEKVGVSTRCQDNAKVDTHGGRSIAPVCCECLRLAVEYKRAWLDEWTEMREYHRRVIQMADSGGMLRSFGTGMLRKETGASAAANHFFQNLAAQGAKHGAYRLARESYTDRTSSLFGNYRQLVFVHDEIVAEIREEAVTECAERMASVMISSMREFVPDVAITAKPAIARRWFKGMEELRDDGGKLVPWWPADWAWGPDQAMMQADRARAH